MQRPVNVNKDFAYEAQILPAKLERRSNGILPDDGKNLLRPLILRVYRASDPIAVKSHKLKIAEEVVDLQQIAACRASVGQNGVFEGEKHPPVNIGVALFICVRFRIALRQQV